jgi:hypothetical protein
VAIDVGLDLYVLELNHHCTQFSEENFWLSLASLTILD